MTNHPDTVADEGIREREAMAEMETEIAAMLDVEFHRPSTRTAPPRYRTGAAKERRV